MARGINVPEAAAFIAAHEFVFLDRFCRVGHAVQALGLKSSYNDSLGVSFWHHNPNAPHNVNRMISPTRQKDCFLIVTAAELFNGVKFIFVTH